MSELDELLGGGRKAAPQPKLTEKGDTFVGRVTGDPRVMNVREFIKGKPGDNLYWQKKKPTRESDLDRNLPFEPMKQIVVPVEDQNGNEFTIYLEGDKLKKAKAYLRENPDERLAEGSMIKVWIDDLDETYNIPKKIWGVVIKAPKD